MDSTPDCQKGFEHQRLEEWNDSSTLSEEEVDQMRANGTSLLKTPKNGRVVKADRKSAERQAKMGVITRNDLRELNSALHPHQAILTEQKRQDATQGLTRNAIEKDLVFNTHTFKYCSLQAKNHNKKVIKANQSRQGDNMAYSPEQTKALIDPILQHLGLSSNVLRATKSRKALDAKLRVAIYKDLLAATNEQAETMQRMAGYWRYVNRRTYNAMVRMNEIWDWATGAKLPEMEEENVISDTANSESDDTLVGSTDLGFSDLGLLTVEAESNIGDSDLSEDTEPPTLSSATETTTSTLIEDGAKTPTQASVFQEAAGGVSPESDSQVLLPNGPERSPGPSFTFTVPSPFSSDDFWTGPEIRLEADMEDMKFAESPSRNLISKQSATWTFGKARDETSDYEDCRFEDEAGHLSSSTKRSSTPNKSKQPKHHRRSRKSLWHGCPPVKEKFMAKDLNNRFEGLEIETAAPREEAISKTPEAPRSVPVMHLSSSSSYFDGIIANKDFPALSGACTPQVEFNVDVPKPKIISIGISAVELVEAKSKSYRIKPSKSLGLERTSAKMTKIWSSNEEGEWTTVVGGKRH